MAETLLRDVPFLRRSDIDPDGTWICQTTERAVDRNLKPDLMSINVAERFGRHPPIGVRPTVGTRASANSDLVEYLQRDDAKWLEHEEVDPVLPQPAP